MFHLRTMDKQERLFHQNFTYPIIKNVCAFAVISMVAKNILESDLIAKGVIVMAVGLVVSKFLKGVDPALINVIAEKKIGESK